MYRRNIAGEWPDVLLPPKGLGVGGWPVPSSMLERMWALALLFLGVSELRPAGEQGKSRIHP